MTNLTVKAPRHRLKNASRNSELAGRIKLVLGFVAVQVLAFVLAATVALGVYRPWLDDARAVSGAVAASADIGQPRAGGSMAAAAESGADDSKAESP